MGEWRRPKGQRKRESDRWGPPPSNNRNWSHGKPPRFPEEKTEMHWEEKFCLINGVRWEKLLETKKYLPQYSDITGWNDSAGKEAFDNAKARYWSQINGRQPEIPLPDPDMFIDIVDHEGPLSDLKLYENLHGSLSDEDEAEGADDCSTHGWGSGGVILWDSHYARKEEEVVWGDFSTGWGDNHPINPTGWGDIPVQSSIQPDPWGVAQASWADNSVNQNRWGNMAADVNPGTTYEGIIATGWGDSEGILATGWGDAEEGGPWNGGVPEAEYWNYGTGNYWNGYESGALGEAGQCWKYWNGSGYNPGNWRNNNYIERYYCPGPSGCNKNGNKSYNNKGKQWRKKEDSSRPFCAPLHQSTQSSDGWNVPRSVA